MDEQINQPSQSDQSGQTNQIPQKKSSLVWVLIIIAAILIIIGLGVYLWQRSIAIKNDLSHQKDIEEYKKENSDLEKQSDLNKETESVAQNDSQKNTAAPGENQPVIQFIPGTFSEAEKNDLTNKVLNPFIDYTKETEGSQPITITVKKFSDAEIASQQYAKYKYSIEAIYQVGYSSWLETETGKSIDYWMPDCMGKCVFSDAYKNKYPENVKKYNSSFE
ncbi:MAG: hypothetical protein V1804_04675 [Patescibacteria group bacterium]